jgi:hypothetical protein
MEVVEDAAGLMVPLTITLLLPLSHLISTVTVTVWDWE